MSYEQGLLTMNQQYQLNETIVDMYDTLINNYLLFIGIWSKYNPQGITQQVGLVGLMDSNCFHYQSLIGKSSKYLQLIYYDCLDPESKTILKVLTFSTLDGQQHIYQIDIDPLEYENVWHLFELLYYPSNNIIEFIMVNQNDILLWKKLDSRLNVENYVKNTIGGGLIVQNSNLNSIQAGTLFSYFPGQMYLISIPTHYISEIYLSFGIIIYVNDFGIESNTECKNNSINSQILDQDLIWLDQKSYISEEINIDSFIFAGWFRITHINQVDDDFTFQFIKISKNTQSQQFSNPNLAPFQLFYKISPNNNKIIITTYSYNFPSVSLDFTNSDNNFIITEEFEINHSISLWHSLFVNLEQDQIFIQIKFFGSVGIYEYSKSLNVKQFNNVLYLIRYGNLMKSVENYLNIQTRNVKFYNCQQQLEEQNCHFSCQNCIGPTNLDCLSCSEASQRIYIPERKACICPYQYFDDQFNQNCLSHFDLLFEIKDLQKSNDCKFGYFEFDDSCYACPSIFSEKQTTCLECIQNAKGWSENSYCFTTVYIDPNGNTVRKEESIETDQNFIFDGLEPYLCKACIKGSFFNIDNIFNQFTQLQQAFQSLCQIGPSHLLYQEFTINLCYKCQLQYCQICTIEMTRQICIKCQKNYQSIDGACIIKYSFPGSEVGCRLPNYLNSFKECKLCQIKNCKYCFEYKKDDLEKSTLYANFEKFGYDEFLNVGCAMCEENYMFDFIIGKCIYKQPSLSTCLRAFVNLDGQEICTLSSTDFSVAPEIINCGKLIQNCLQCIITPLYEVKCIICNVGLVASIRYGNCYKQTLESVNAKIVIEGETYWDASIQRIQSFMMKFLPNQYYYQKFQYTQFYFPQEIECNKGDQLYQSNRCLKYCTSECLDCQENKNAAYFYCATCPLNYYLQPIRMQDEGSCIRCAELCDICQIRSEAEIKKLNPYFLLTDENKRFLILNCQILLYSKLQFRIHFYIVSFYLKNRRVTYIQYCNQIGLQVLKFQINFPHLQWEKYQYVCESKKYIFSLQVLKIELNFSYYQGSPTYFYGFDEIEIKNVYFSQRVTQILFQNQNQKVNLILNNIVIYENSYNNINPLFNSDLFGDITLDNIIIYNSNFTSSSLFKLNQQFQQGKLKISKMRLQNCIFTNSQLFWLINNNQVQIQIDELLIYETVFLNSSFITFITNTKGQSRMEFKDITITSSQFVNSFIFNFTNLQEITINNVLLNNNSIFLSTIFVFNKDFSMFQTSLESNKFVQSYFLATLETQSKEYIYFLVDNCKIFENEFNNTNLFYISNENMYFKLKTVQIYFNQGQANQNRISLFNIHCFQLEIDNIQIVEQYNLGIFYFLEVVQIFVSNIIYENQNINIKVPSNMNCINYKYQNYQLILISGYSVLTLKNIKAIKLFSIDLQLIEISSTRKRWTEVPLSLEIINLEFLENLLLHQNEANYLSLISIKSEHNTIIQIENIRFEKNFIHQQIDDSQDSAASLIHIDLFKGQIKINNFQCSYNALTNSSNPFIYLKSDFITLTNYNASKHNIIPLELWNLYYDLQLGNEQYEYDQEQINLIISQIFKIKNKCGAGLIAASNFICFNCFFEDIIGLKSSVFEIKSQGEGQVQLRNIKINSSEYDLSQITESSGCITIYSSNSMLNLKIINAVFENTFNRMAASILTLSPSLYQNNILIQDVIIKNCISLKNPIINIAFSTQNINSNKIVIQNVNINFQEEVWVKYFGKTGMINQNEIIEITGTSNALIQLQNCNVVLTKILFSGVFSCPLIKLINLSYLQMSSIQAIEIKVFYGLNLLEIKQELSINLSINIKYGKFQRISIYDVVNNPIYQNSKINYMIKGCFQIENVEQEKFILLIKSSSSCNQRKKQALLFHFN
ncbi:unnamed protein product [Paramecium octaurelia]|uniref:Uncharacterized protein n=1 Tax=Paramecium octaurelia TaxID=43137 RepID=A0A8S1YM10_PAROT|nr:unnamed protein product [Paramecium octaurelia]